MKASYCSKKTKKGTRIEVSIKRIGLKDSIYYICINTKTGAVMNCRPVSLHRLERFQIPCQDSDLSLSCYTDGVQVKMVMMRQ